MASCRDFAAMTISPGCQASAQRMSDSQSSQEERGMDRGMPAQYRMLGGNEPKQE